MQSTFYMSVEWSSEHRMFLIVSNESMANQLPLSELASDHHNFIKQTFEDNDQELRELNGRFNGCIENHDASLAIAEMQTFRTQILTKVLETRTPLRWFPAFLLAWQDVLSSMDGSGDIQLASTDLIDYCRELMALSGGWKLIGDIAQARSTLGKCFDVTRRYLKAPFTQTVLFEDDDSQALRDVVLAAKKLLLDCVAFQTSLACTKELFKRHQAPGHVQASLSKEFWKLLREAPFSVELALFLVQSWMKQRQFAMVTRFLEHSPFSTESGDLTLIRARALAYVGFYRQSIRIVDMFIRHGNRAPTEALQTHRNHLKQLIALRERADEWLRLDQYEKAMEAYEECLALVDPADQKQRSALLFGHANAFLGQKKVPAAIKDFKMSLQLDPANKIASIRLQTACLQLETERIQKEISRNRPDDTRRTMSRR